MIVVFCFQNYQYIHTYISFPRELLVTANWIIHIVFYRTETHVKSQRTAKIVRTDI